MINMFRCFDTIVATIPLLSDSITTHVQINLIESTFIKVSSTINSSILLSVEDDLFDL
jgi:hypothetical protein